MSLTASGVTAIATAFVLVVVWLLLARLKADPLDRGSRDLTGLFLAALGATIAGGVCAVAADHTVPGLHDSWCGVAGAAAEAYAKQLIGFGVLLGAASGACWDRYLRLHNRSLTVWLSQQLLRAAVASAAILAVGLGLLVLQPREYWVARYFGQEAKLSGAMLSYKTLCGAFLLDASLRGADFTGANLTRAHLGGSDLRGAQLTNANLTRANLARAKLGGASFRGATLNGAQLYGADVKGADFREADLRSASMNVYCLCQCDLRGADLRGADLCDVLEIRQVRLEGAIYDRHTRWRSGFNPLRHGARKVQ
jgi:uncharacterized protein YjbI with pentapeptide repeats